MKKREVIRIKYRLVNSPARDNILIPKNNVTEKKCKLKRDSIYNHKAKCKLTRNNVLCDNIYNTVLRDIKVKKKN